MFLLCAREGFSYKLFEKGLCSGVGQWRLKMWSCEVQGALWALVQKYIPVISETEGYLLWWSYKFKEPENDCEKLKVHTTKPICFLNERQSAHTSINYMI